LVLGGFLHIYSAKPLEHTKHMLEINWIYVIKYLLYFTQFL